MYRFSHREDRLLHIRSPEASRPAEQPQTATELRNQADIAARSAQYVLVLNQWIAANRGTPTVNPSAAIPEETLAPPRVPATENEQLQAKFSADFLAILRTSLRGQPAPVVPAPVPTPEPSPIPAPTPEPPPPPPPSPDPPPTPEPPPPPPPPEPAPTPEPEPQPEGGMRLQEGLVSRPDPLPLRRPDSRPTPQTPEVARQRWATMQVKADAIVAIRASDGTVTIGKGESLSRGGINIRRSSDGRSVQLQMEPWGDRGGRLLVGMNESDLLPVRLEAEVMDANQQFRYLYEETKARAQELIRSDTAKLAHIEKVWQEMGLNGRIFYNAKVGLTGLDPLEEERRPIRARLESVQGIVTRQMDLALSLQTRGDWDKAITEMNGARRQLGMRVAGLSRNEAGDVTGVTVDIASRGHRSLLLQEPSNRRLWELDSIANRLTEITIKEVIKAIGEIATSGGGAEGGKKMPKMKGRQAVSIFRRIITASGNPLVKKVLEKTVEQIAGVLDIEIDPVESVYRAVAKMVYGDAYDDRDLDQLMKDLDELERTA